MNNGKYTIKKFLTDENMEQIIIPEIQRDYVWGQKNVENLLNSLNEESNSQLEVTIAPQELESLRPEVRYLTLRALEENKKYSNIGFIYGYHDAGFENKYFLVDGQQRLTTIFLLLLALSVDENINNFRNSYFAHNIPKLDYKVREVSHDFLVNFIEFILTQKDLADLKNQFWYFSDYDSDITIQSIIKNYKVVKDFISRDDCALNFEFVENNIEFWYFDTNQSKQGEELYIYMNSRGENAQPYEKIKSILLKGLSDQEKDYWGKEWEEWQNFFWKNRNLSEESNADDGFNQFLKWIKIIYFITDPSSNDISISEKESNIKEIIFSKDIDQKFLNLLDIRNNFIGLKKLYAQHKNDYLKQKWLHGKMDQADYIRLLPVLMFVNKNREASTNDIKRFTRFFYNLPRIDTIRRNPNQYAVHCVNLTNDFLSDGHIDITNLRNYQSNINYRTILTKEEIFKLNLYHSPPTDVLRKDLENEFWKAEDYSLNNGKISFIFNCMDLDISVDPTNFVYTKFSELSRNLLELFGDSVSPSDTFRRALLTKGNYALEDGSSPKLGGKRWTLINTQENWRNLIQHQRKMRYLKELILHYSNLRQRESNTEDILNFLNPK